MNIWDIFKKKNRNNLNSSLGLALMMSNNSKSDIELPKNATAIDFAYRIHSKLGNTMVSAVVNDHVVEPDYILQNKDRVRIITDLLAYGPHQEWIDKVQTIKARRKIREFYKK